MPRRSYGPIPKKRAKRLLEALLDYGKQELEVDENICKRLKVIPRQDGLELFVVGTLELLAELTNADHHPGKLTENEVETGIDYLEKFLEILKRETQQGSPEWRLTITLWHSDKEKNLKAFEDECKRKNTEKKPKAGQDPWVRVRKFVPSEFDLLDDKFFKARGRGESRILRLPSATWSLITQGNYIDRDRQEDVLAMAEELAEYDGISLLLIRGQLGAGKTALMRWLAYQLSNQENIVLQKCGDELYWLRSLREFSDRHFYLIADDLFRDETILEELERNELQFPLTLIGTTQLNEDQQDRLRHRGYPIQSLDLELYPSEKERVLQGVCQQDPEAKARLEQMPSAERDQLMASPSMLVLMLQLSEGKEFDLIVAKVIKRLPSDANYPVYQVFGVICSFYQYSIITPIEVLSLCLPDHPSKAVRNVVDIAIEVELKGLVNNMSRRGYEGLGTIHELIAQTAISVKYSRRPGENLPYSFSLLEDYLRTAIQALDPTQPNHTRWISDGLRRLVMNSKDKLVRKILNDYPEVVQALQQKGSITEWLSWAKVYEAVGLLDERDRCLNVMLFTEPQTPDERVYWLSLTARLGTNKQKQQAIAQTATWLQNHSQDYHVRTQYLAMIIRRRQYATSQQKREAIAQTATWLEQHPEDYHVRTLYLKLIVKYGKLPQKQETINHADSWLQQDPGNTSIRTQYLILIKECGTLQQKQEAIAQTAIWIEQHPENTSIRTQYLILIRECGTLQQKQEAIAQTAIWIEQHPELTEVRKNYLYLVRKAGQEIIDIRAIIAPQWQWLSQQPRVEKSLWESFLKVFLDHAQFHPNLVPFIQPAINLALEQYPKNRWIILKVFSYFRYYLDSETCYRLANVISEYQFMKEIASSQNFIYVANFFRDEGELDKAEAMYQQVLKITQSLLNKQKGNIQNLQKSINFASLSYASLLLLRQPSDLDMATEYLDYVLNDNPKHGLAHFYLAQCYQKKGENFYTQAINHFEQAIKFDQQKTGQFWYQFGCFCRDAMDDRIKAHECFENSLNQKTNLLTYVDLAELEIESGNYNIAKELLQKGLSLSPTTRPEKEQREQLKDHIEVLLQKINSNMDLQADNY